MGAPGFTSKGGEAMKMVREKAGNWLLFAGLLTAWNVSPGFVSPAEAAQDWKARWDRAVNEAKKEGSVVVWGPPGDLIRQALTEGFQKAFPGINVEFTGSRGTKRPRR
jgi:hypothetical protein